MKKCAICGTLIDSSLLNWTDPHKIFYCGICHTLQTETVPKPEELEKFYQGFTYDYYKNRDYKMQIKNYADQLRRFFKNYIRKDESISFLDYGGGIGLKALAAKTLGFDVWLFEKDLKAVEIAVEKFRFDKDRIITSEKHLYRHKYNCILSDNVIEHIPDPVNHVKVLYEVLKPGGSLVVKTPNSRSVELLFYPIIVAQYMKKSLKNNSVRTSLSKCLFFRSWCCDPPRHLFGFSKKSAELILKKNGITEAEMGYYSVPLFRNTVVSYLFSDPRKLLRQSGFIKLFMIPVTAVTELILKILQTIMCRTGIVSKAGLWIQVEKPS